MQFVGIRETNIFVYGKNYLRRYNASLMLKESFEVVCLPYVAGTVC
jgi:hypothetical protein